MIDEEEKFEELLCDWELARQEGCEVSIEELCATAPQLLERVRKGIGQLKATSWMLNDEAQNLLPANIGFVATHHERDTELPESELTIVEFAQTASSSGILSDTEIEELNRYAREHQTLPTKTFAATLVEHEILTNYQARVILEKGKSPLLLDRYIILDTIGSGGMGLVFKALHRSMERIVALKVLPRFAVNSAEKVSRFQREIKATAKISHPNVVAAFDAHESNGTFFLVMEFVDGVNLMEHVDEHGPLSVGDSVSILAQVSAGLEEAHQNGIVHRDIKPTNIMLSRDGVAKLLDLGLARTKELAKETTSNELTRDGLAMGTVDYMSPEQALDSKDADVQSDLYSLGCTLYFLLMGKPPFERSTTVKTIIAHREDDPPSLLVARNDLPKPLEKIFFKLVAKVPSDRYESAAELRGDLLGCGVEFEDSVIRHVPATKTSVLNQTPSAKDRDYQLKRQTFHWRTWLPIAGLAIAAMVVGGWVLLNLSSAPLANSASQRDIAKWVLAGEGAIEIKTSLGSQSLFSMDELPDSDFEIVTLELQGLDERLSLKPISQLKQLNSLNINGFHDFNLRDLKDLPALTDLTISGESVGDQEIVGVASLRRLKSLDLSDSVVTDASVDRIIEMGWLKDLYLSGSDVTNTGIRKLSSMSRLETLGLASTSFSGEQLQYMPQSLMDLYAAGCKLGDQDVAELGKLKQLKGLDLRETELTDAGIVALSKLKNLEELYLDGMIVSATSLIELSKLTNLTLLSLEGLDVTQDCLAAILKMTNLESLDLDNSSLDDGQLMQLTKLKNLTSLLVAQTKTSDEGINEFLDELPDCMVYSELE